MKIYQLNYLLPAELEIEKIQSIALKIESFIQGQGGVLIGERTDKKIDLGQPVRKNRKAILLNLKFQLKPQKLNLLEEGLRKTSEILRFMILGQKEAKKKVPKKIKTPKILGKQIKKQGSKKEEKVELKEIEKQLEQILEK